MRNDYLDIAKGIGDRNALEGGKPHGAVLITPGGFIVTGADETAKKHDPTAHAELIAIRLACAHLEVSELPGTVIYSSSRPCPMCRSAASLTGAIIMTTKGRAL